MYNFVSAIFIPFNDVVYVVFGLSFIGANVLVSNFGINGATFSCTTTLALQFIMYTIATKVIMYKENKKIDSH